jgi:hypothetical protein
MKKPSETANGPFDDNVSLCMTCAKEQATHEIHISCTKGLIWDTSKKSVFSINYSVCGGCARQVVEVKLAADLRAEARIDNNIEASLHAELKAIRELAEKTLRDESPMSPFSKTEALRRISHGTVR